MGAVVIGGLAEALRARKRPPNPDLEGLEKSQRKAKANLETGDFSYSFI